MADVFRSKEIYKQIRNTDYTPKIIPVRNVYVSGEWLTPVYMDHCCTISTMTSSIPNIRDFTTAEKDAVDKDGHINIITVDADKLEQNVDWYTTAIKDAVDKDGHINIITVDADALQQNLDWYYRTEKDDVDKDGHINIITVDANVLPQIISEYVGIKEIIGSDFGIRLSTMTSSIPTINDLTS